MVWRNVASFAVSRPCFRPQSRVANHRPHLTLVEGRRMQAFQLRSVNMDS